MFHCFLVRKSWYYHRCDFNLLISGVRISFITSCTPLILWKLLQEVVAVSSLVVLIRYLTISPLSFHLDHLIVLARTNSSL